MKYYKAADKKCELYYRHVSIDNTIEVGIWPTLFGYRVRAGQLDAMTYDIDYCAGNEQYDVELLWSVVVNILEQDVKLRDFPLQRYKPILLNDPECWNTLLRMTNDYELRQLPNVVVYKLDYFDAVMNTVND